MAARPMMIALAGNPNVGKSTIFNALTGARQHVGNWPGKTVEKKEGWATVNGHDLMIVDLPGTYSLAAYSVEEIIARDFILHERPSLIVAVVDAANLERNLYLVCQLLDLGTPVVIALNMSDTARSRGLQIDPQALGQALGSIPVIETVGSRGIGLDALKTAINSVDEHSRQPHMFAYDHALESEINRLQQQIDTVLNNWYPPRWLAIRLLENDPEITARLESMGHQALITAALEAAERISVGLGDDPETLMTDARYQFIGQIVAGVVTRPNVTLETASDHADRIITHHIWGLPIFLLLMWLVFQITANVSAPLVDWVGGMNTGPFTRWAHALISALGLGNSWIESLIVDGIIRGVGGVLVFVPLLMFLYLTIGLLEDSGYMARAAFVMDRVMRVIGLHGKSFLPLLIGFGCTVPAVYATRTLENEQDRKLTGFLTTFMSCGARLPVYVVFAAAFFGTNAGNLIFALYLTGIGTAMLTGLIFKRTVYRGKPPQPFVMELPPYRLPNPRTVFLQTWERTRGFVRKATTVILTCSIIVWLLMALPRNLDFRQFSTVAPEDSIFSALSGAIAPVFVPAGFSNWRAAGSLLTGLVAKEVVVSTMSQAYGVESGNEVADDSGTTFAEDVGQIINTFGTSLVLTGQEIINIVPRTLNIIPVLHLSEANFAGSAPEEDTSELSAALSRVFTPLSAVAFLVFVLLYTPCMIATAAMRQEFGGRWTLYQIAYTLMVAWLGAVIVYQGGLMLGLGG